MVNRKDELEKLENANHEKKQAIIEKLENLEKRKKETMEKHAQEIHKMIEKQNNNYEKILHNQNENLKIKEKRNLLLLEYQLSHSGRAKQKEDEVILSRFNAQ